MQLQTAQLMCWKSQRRWFKGSDTSYCFLNAGVAKHREDMRLTVHGQVGCWRSLLREAALAAIISANSSTAFQVVEFTNTKSVCGFFRI